MVSVYLDDSGKESDPRGQYVVMAGYLATDSHWSFFQGAWVHLLLKHKIDHIHMRHLIPLQGVYNDLGWNTAKRDEVLADFIGAIKNADLIGFGVAIDAVAYRSILPEAFRKKEGDAQQFCFLRIARMLANRMKRAGLDDFLALTFDTDREFAAARFRLFLEIWNRDPEARVYLASIAFADVLKYPQLQAADMLAWESRKDLIQQTGGHESTGRWKDLFTAFPGRPLDYDGELWDEVEIRKTLLPLAEAGLSGEQ